MSRKMLTLDRTITMSLVFTVLVQTATALLWVGAAEARLVHLETLSADHTPVAERLARLEAQMVEMHHSLDRIEARLEAIND